MSAVLSPIVLDELGRAWISGTATKVSEVVLNHEWSNHSVDDLCEAMPHLSRFQITEALDYYRRHRDAMEREIADGTELAQRLRAQMGQSPAGLKLKAMREGK